MKCRACGADVADGKEFCGMCGVAIDQLRESRKAENPKKSRQVRAPKQACSTVSSIFLIAIFALTLASAQIPSQTLRTKLATLFPASGQGAPGTEITLVRDGLWMYGEESSRPLANTYKNGAISQSIADALLIKTTLPAYRENPPGGNPHLRKFSKGDRLRVIGTAIKNDVVELTLESDLVNYVRYIATLKFAGPDKKSPLSPEAFEAAVGEMMRVAPPAKAEVASVQPPSSNSAAASAPNAPASPLIGTKLGIDGKPLERKPTGIATDPATADILGIRLGMTSGEVLQILEKRIGRAAGQAKGIGLACHDAFCRVVDDNGFTPGKQHTQRIFYSDEKVERLMVVFVEIYPYEPARPEIVVEVEYLPKLASEADRTDFRNRVVAKFGPGLGKEDMEWCRYLLGPEPNSYCEQPTLRMASWSTNHIGLYLRTDNSLYEQERALWESQRHAAAPPL